MIRWPGEQGDFPHDEVGYELRMSHAKLDCRGCHQSKLIANPEPLRDHGKDLDRTFLGLETTCTSCHQDVHESTVGTDCVRCHDESVWKPAPGFDHASTIYPLLGKHVDVSCEKCHPTTPRFLHVESNQCSDCHSDPHAGVLGADCGRCHDPSNWAQVAAGEFDHDETKFPLVGAHQVVSCDRCHISGQSAANRLFCDQCHRDTHEGVFAQKSNGRADCAHCHSSVSFVPSNYGFARHADSRYPLTGAHLAVPCGDCHNGGDGTASYRFDRLDCAACHADVHENSYRRVVQVPEPCSICHTTDSWSETEFDHDTTGYRLEAAHETAACADCHSPEIRQAVRGWESATAAPMRFRLAGVTDTESPSAEAQAWSRFRDQLMEERAVVRAVAARDRGAGASAGRGAVLRFDDSPTQCTDCHRDPHAGQFEHYREEVAVAQGQESSGVACLRCHDLSNWSADRFDHTQTRYPLDGAHEKVLCSGCHRREPDGVQRFRPLGIECQDCHASAPGVQQ